MAGIVNIVNELYRRFKPSKRLLSTVDTIVIHHDAARPPKNGNWFERLENYAHMHAAEFKAHGIGYHYAIAPDGSIYKCNDISDITSHAGGANKHSIGIMLMGNFHINKQKPTNDQITSLAKLIHIITESMPTIRYIIPHREVRYRTDCPGQYFTNEMIPHYCGKRKK